MEVKIKVRYLIIALLVCIVTIWALFAVVRGRYHSEVDNAMAALYQSERTVSEYKIKVGELEETVYENSLIILSKDDELFKLEEEGDRLRELNIKQVSMIGRLNTRIKFLEENIVPNDTIIIVEDCDGDGSFVKLPLTYMFKDQWVSTSTVINEKALGTISFEMFPTPLNIIIGEKGMGLFKKKEDVVVVTSPNPYLVIDNSSVAVVDNSPNPLTGVAIGAGSTLALVLVLHVLLGK